MYFCTFADKESKTCNKCCGWACQLLICMTSCYTVCHLFGKIHQNKAPAPLLTSRNEGNVLSVPPLETHGMVLRVICHCWQVFYAALSGPVKHHVLWHTPGNARQRQATPQRSTCSSSLVLCQSISGPVWRNSLSAVAPENGALRDGTVSAVAWSFTLLLSLLEWRIYLNLTSDSWSVDKPGQWKDLFLQSCKDKISFVSHYLS